jgi:hypothetical protein
MNDKAKMTRGALEKRRVQVLRSGIAHRFRLYTYNLSYAFRANMWLQRFLFALHTDTAVFSWDVGN